MGRKKALTPEEFAAAYKPLRAADKTKPEIAKGMGIDLRTLYRYLDDPDYVNTDNSATIKADLKGGTRANKLIKDGYDLFEAGIKCAKKKKDFVEARKLIIEALKLTKAEADINRVFNMFIDARDQSTNITQIRATVEAETAESIFEGPLRCPECGADVAPVLLARHTGGDGDGG